MRRSSCNFSSLLRNTKGESRYSREYRVVAILTARWVLKRRSRFDTFMVMPALRGRRLTEKTAPSTVQAWVKQFLSSWEEGADQSHSQLADEALKLCPQLHDKVVKYWEGY